MQAQIVFVLYQTSHPGNIGAVARAMLTMGQKHLRLVQPKVFPHPEATAMASGALEVLEQAQCFNDLASAVADCHFVVGTSARQRDFPWPIFTPRTIAEHRCNLPADQRMAIIFGPERIGLTNQDLDLCHAVLHIPANPSYASLNLAQAVQIIAYEFWQTHKEPINPEKTELLATAGELAQFYDQLHEVVYRSGYANPNAPRLLMRRLRRLFHRIQLEHAEVQILRGLLTTWQNQLPRIKADS